MSNYSVKQVIVMRRTYMDAEGKKFKLRTGKMIAQACHASMIFMSEIITQKKTLTEEQREWIFGSFAKICVYVETEDELKEIYYKAAKEGLTVRMVTDAGNTEFHGIPTQTCLAIGPNYSEEIDKITGDLPLL